MKLQISFTIDPKLTSNGKQLLCIKTKHIDEIIRAIRFNGRLNSEDNFVSCEIGTIKLIDCIINKINSNLLSVTFIVEANCNTSLEHLEEIIWTIFPVAYSDDLDYVFKFSIDDKSSQINYLMTVSNFPNNIQLVVL